MARAKVNRVKHAQDDSIEQGLAMSACGYKRTYSGQLANVRFTPNSGHSEGSVITYALPPKAEIGGANMLRTKKADIQCPLNPQKRT